MNQKKYVDLIQALIEMGHITFWSHSRFGGIVMANVTSDIFTDSAFGLDIDEDLWNDGPSRAVACVIVDALDNDKLHVRPELLVEKH